MGPEADRIVSATIAREARFVAPVSEPVPRIWLWRVVGGLSRGGLALGHAKACRRRMPVGREANASSGGGRRRPSSQQIPIVWLVLVSRMREHPMLSRWLRSVRESY